MLCHRKLATYYVVTSIKLSIPPLDCQRSMRSASSFLLRNGPVYGGYYPLAPASQFAAMLFHLKIATFYVVTSIKISIPPLDGQRPMRSASTFLLRNGPVYRGY